MARKNRQPWSPSDYVFFGVIAQVVAGAVLGFGFVADLVIVVVLGSVVASVGTLMTLVGVVGQGVLVGMRARAFDEYRDA